MIQLKDSKNSISESFEKKLLFAIILTVFNYSGPSNHLFGNFQGLFPCVVNLSSKIPKMCHNICPEIVLLDINECRIVQRQQQKQ